MAIKAVGGAVGILPASPERPSSAGRRFANTQSKKELPKRGGVRVTSLPMENVGGARHYTSMTDAEVMLCAGKGDNEAFDYLVNKYRRPMFSFMYRMTHNQAAAEELAQEVFLRVYRSRAGYAADAKFTTWLYRIATNLAANHARDTKSERTAPTVHLDEPDAETGSMPDVADQQISVEQRLLRDERMQGIRKQVMELPERQRMAVLMHKYQDMDYKQIAGVLKLSESATKSLLFRAYETLRERLKDYV